MQLSLRSLALTSAIVWGGSILLTGLINLAVPGYGRVFLELCASLYPGYELSGTLGSVLVGTGYGLVDGAVIGAIFAWIYNRVTASVGTV